MWTDKEDLQRRATKVLNLMFEVKHLKIKELLRVDIIKTGEYLRFFLLYPQWE